MEVMVTFTDAVTSVGAVFAGGRNNSECGRVAHDSAAVDLTAINPDQRPNYTVSKPGASECPDYTISGAVMTLTCPSAHSIVQINGHGSCYLYGKKSGLPVAPFCVFCNNTAALCAPHL